MDAGPKAIFRDSISVCCHREIWLTTDLIFRATVCVRLARDSRQSERALGDTRE